MLMPFGKHKGTEVKDCPKHYLNWAIRNLDLFDPLKSEIKRALLNNSNDGLSNNGEKATEIVRGNQSNQ